MRFGLTFAAVLGLAVCNPAFSLAQGKGRQGGGGKCGSQQTTNSPSTTSSPTTTTQTSVSRNQLLLQQALQQRLLLQQGIQQQLVLRQAIGQQQMAFQQSIAPQQSSTQYLESVVAQQSDFELQGSLNSNDSRVRQAATKEWKRRNPYE